MTKTPRLAKRMQDIRPFYVMDILARARELEAAGQTIVHMEIGEPDFPTPLTVIEAGRQALAELKTHYTPALGLPALRAALSTYYAERYGVDVPSSRIIITPGASGALQLALAVLVNPGDKVLMADPGYPCNRHMVRLFEGETVSVPVTAKTAYQLTSELIDQFWDQACIAAMVATPSNPTGTRLNKSSLSALIDNMQQKNGSLIVDEIYQGLVYSEDDFTALSLSDDLFVINSFSKYFGMTGWRLGWMVVPETYVSAIDHVAQNIFLAPSTPAQYAAIEALSDTTISILDQRCAEFKQRRDYLLPALRELGFGIAVEPEGAFYIYANCTAFSEDSFKLCADLLEHAGVAATPGIDFGQYQADKHIRFAYTQPIEQLREGIKRMHDYLKG